MNTPSRLIVVCDLEATCWNDGEELAIDKMEVIEIGCVLADMDGTIQDEFCTFVSPVVNPILSPFCSSLTGISQDDVNSAPTFKVAIGLLDHWLAERATCWGSWGNFDNKLLVSETRRNDIESRFLSIPHINLKKAWRRTTKKRRQNSLGEALRYHGLEFFGSPHRGIDDARNTARLLSFIPKKEIDIQLADITRQLGDTGLSRSPNDH